MIRSFSDRGTADIFDGNNTKAARRACPPTLWHLARRKLDQLNAATSRYSLRFPPGNRWEKLERCYVWTSEGPTRVEIVDYH